MTSPSGYDFYWTYDSSAFSRFSSWWNPGMFKEIFPGFPNLLFLYFLLIGEPNNSLNNEYCATLTTIGGINDIRCTYSTYPLCKL